jgi:hypothetical protein
VNDKEVEDSNTTAKKIRREDTKNKKEQQANELALNFNAGRD